MLIDKDKELDKMKQQWWEFEDKFKNIRQNINKIGNIEVNLSEREPTDDRTKILVKQVNDLEELVNYHM